MSMVQQLDRIGQVPNRFASVAADFMADAAAGWALIRALDAKFGNPACAICCEPTTVGEHCAACDEALERVGRRVLAAVAVPADFAAAVADHDAGVRYVEPGSIDWAAVESETWG